MSAPRVSAGASPAAPLPLATAAEVRALVWRALHQRPLQLGLSVLLSLAAAATALAGPWLVGLLVDAVLSGGDRADVLGYTLWLAGAGVGGALLTMASAAAVARLGQELVGSLREQALEAALHLPPETIEAAGSGDVLGRIGDDVAVVSGIVSALLAPLVGATLAVGLTVAGLAALNPWLALAGLCAAPVYYFSLRWYLPRAAPRYAVERVRFAARAEVVVAALTGARTVRAYRAEDAFSARIEDASEDARAVSKDVLWFYTGWSKWLNFAELAGLGMILLLGYVLVDGGAVTLGALTTAALFFHRLFNPIGVIVGSFDEIQSATASLARIAGLAGAPGAAPAGRPDATAVVAAAPRTLAAAVTITALSHSFGAHRVLDDVSVHIAAGQRVALVGSSGAGKSTLAAVVAGLIVPDAGTVRLGAAGAGVVLVTQDSHVFSGPLCEDLRLARPTATPADLHDALQLVGAAAWVDALPQGMNTVIGELGEPLDAEQVAQLALARAALADPAVLILDEATADASGGGTARLERAAAAVMAGRTGIVVAHRLSQVATCDRVVVLEHGSIVEQGTHERLLADGGRYAALWAAWGK